MVFGYACAARTAAGSSRPAAARVASGLPSKGRFDFPATIRLKRRADFQRVYRHGVRETGGHVVLFVMRAEDGAGRFGVTASRRVGGAVVRTRCKRRLRELYRLHRHELGGHAYEVVANARSGCARAPWGDLEREFLRCLRRGVRRAQEGRKNPPEA